MTEESFNIMPNDIIHVTCVRPVHVRIIFEDDEGVIFSEVESQTIHELRAKLKESERTNSNLRSYIAGLTEGVTEREGY